MKGPAPAGAIVAVLSKRGRFLVAEPFFAQSRSEGSPTRSRNSERIVITPGRDSASRAAKIGDLVLVQRASSPSRRSSAVRGPQIVRVLGRPEVARDVIEALMLDRGLRRGFDPMIEREARQASKLAEHERGRADLRRLTTFTIDPIDARDFDDAISAERLQDGTMRVWVHIADVSAYVPEGSALDREARRRATSVYVPGAVEPMLPHALSSDACSLVPGHDRMTVTVELELRGARVTSSSFYRSVIRSDARLDYEQVDRIFAGQESAAEPWRAPLSAAREAAAALGREREHAGALRVDSHEPEFSFDQNGHVLEIFEREQTESHRLIEHLMIAANEAVARRLSESSTPCLYRVHELPDPERVRRLVEQLASLEVPTPPLPDPLYPAQAAELVGKTSHLIHTHVRRTGMGRIALSSLVLRSLKQASYSPKNIGHAGLHSTHYCHFTSPIRRYPDLVCHRSLLHLVDAKAATHPPDKANLGELASWTSERERDAMRIERDADDVARCFALENLLYRDGWKRTFAGEVSGVISAGAFVAFGPSESDAESVSWMPIYEGMLPLRRMGEIEQAQPARSRTGAPKRSSERDRPGGQEREWWELDDLDTSLRASRSGKTLRLGDPIQVRVVRVESARGRVDLEIAAS